MQGAACTPFRLLRRVAKVEFLSARPWREREEFPLYGGARPDQKFWTAVTAMSPIATDGTPVRVATNTAAPAPLPSAS